MLFLYHFYSRKGVIKIEFWNFTNKAATETEPEEVELRINGDIVDDGDTWFYEWFKEPCASPNKFRTELSSHKNKPITVWVDSYGGSVYAAAGIYNSLKEHKGGVTVKIDGKAMSAATIVAMAADKGKLLISPTAIMMVHNPLTGAYGYASDLRKTADILDEVKECIMNAYASRTGRSRTKLAALMDEETYMSAKTAIKEGFADAMLYTESEAKPVDMAFNRQAILNSTNDAIKRFVEKQKPDNTTALALLKLTLET